MSENHEKMLLRVMKQLTVLRENSCLIVSAQQHPRVLVQWIGPGLNPKISVI